MALVVLPEGTAGLYCGPTTETWSKAAGLSEQRHVVWLEKPVKRALAIMPPMYTDLWTGAKGMYKLEPVIADGGELVIYAPHIHEVSSVHGKVIDEIGYHCRDYFLAQWDRFGEFRVDSGAFHTTLRGRDIRRFERRRGATNYSNLGHWHSRGPLPPHQSGVPRSSQREPGGMEPARRLASVKRAGEMLYRIRPYMSNGPFDLTGRVAV